MTDAVCHARVLDVWASLGGPPHAAEGLAITGAGALPSVFAVSDLACASVGAAGLALAEVIAATGGPAARVTIDRRLASFWFSASLKPMGWVVPPLWDAIAGDYRTRDGWIRLHTNAPHHKRAAQSVLGPHETREAMAAAVATWDGRALEDAVVAAKGCAAEMRSMAAWAGHPAGVAAGAEPLAAVSTVQGRAARDWPADRARPLAGLRVLDLTRVLAGPVATRFLAGYGADVLRVDPPDWDEPGVVPEMAVGKRCARLDLRKAEDRATFARLLSRADIMVSGYRSTALEGLGFGPKERQELSPGLIDIALDAYGWTGPWQARRGFDSLVQMSSGIADAGMRWKGTDKPFPLPCQALDHAAGYLLAAAALRGLARRARDGSGASARLSLARTAKLLTDWGEAAEAPAFAPQDEEDFATPIEATQWGPARRLIPPVSVSGAPMAWDIPARALGSDAAGWREA